MAPPKTPGSSPDRAASGQASDADRGLGRRGTSTADRGLVHLPVLASRCAARDIVLPDSAPKFWKILEQWIATCVTSRTIRDPRTGEPFKREMELVDQSPSSKEVWRQIEIGGLRDSRGQPRTVRVYADYEFVALGREEWGVSAVRFSVREPPPPPPPPKPPAERFDFDDIKQGEELLGHFVDEAHKIAQGKAPMPKVTVSGTDLLANTAKRSWYGLGKDVLAGSVQDLGRSNAAYDVTKRRGILYDAYVDGAVSVLFPNEPVSATRADREEQEFFDLDTCSCQSRRERSHSAWLLGHCQAAVVGH